MLKFKQKTESEQTYSSPESLMEPTTPTVDTEVIAEANASQPLLATSTGPSLAGIPFSRRNLFGIEWSNLHPRNLRNIRLKIPRHQRQRRKFVWTRSRKVAAVTLAITGLLGGRWFYANLPPTVMVPPKTPETLSAPNAQHFYAAATEALSSETSKKIEDAFSLIYDKPRAAETLAERRAAVQAAGSSLALMRQGFGYQYSGFQTNWTKGQISPYSLSSPVPNYVQIRVMARLFAVESSVLAAEGKYGTALSASLDAVRFGQDVGQTPTLIGGMIGRLCQDIGNKEALSLINHLSASEARQAIPRVGQLVEQELTMPRVLEGERLVMNTTFGEFMRPQTSAASFAGGIGPLLGGDLFSTAALLVSHGASVFVYTNQGIVDAYNQHMDRMIQQASLPYQQARFPTEAQRNALPPLVREMMPHVERANKFLTLTRARNRVLLTQLAVQAYQQEHNGAFPKTLDDLTLGRAPYLTTIPSDPFSQTGTDPLRYANGKVYSVGVNGKDDSGQGDDQLDLK